jgi:hypothetical protein
MANQILTLGGDARHFTVSDDLTNSASAIPTVKAIRDNVQGILNLSAMIDTLGTAANGDMMYRDGGVWVLLPKGSDGQVLTLASGLPVWATP